MMGVVGRGGRGGIGLGNKDQEEGRGLWMRHLALGVRH